MDLSTEYILMCKKAEEIQSNWKTKAFDIYQDIVIKMPLRELVDFRH